MNDFTGKNHVLHVDDDSNLTELVADFLERKDDREGRTHSSDDVKAEYGLNKTARDGDE